MIQKRPGRPCRDRHPSPETTAEGCPTCKLFLGKFHAAWLPAEAPGAEARGPGAAAGGPGTELKRLLAELFLVASPGCACNKKAMQMDAWGVAGCRERREEIVGWLRD